MPFFHPPSEAIEIADLFASRGLGTRAERVMVTVKIA